MSKWQDIERIGATIHVDLDYSKMGYWRIGGVLSTVVDVHTLAQAQAIALVEEPTVVLGNGSNMLMSDRGIEGIALRFVGDFEQVEYGADHIVVGAGMRNVVLLNRLKAQHRGGLGALAGVPGTIGGAIRMNAGTYLGEIASAVIWVEWIDSLGTLHRSTKEDLGFSYRKVQLPWDGLIVRVCLQTQPSNSEEQAKIQQHLQRRTETQPLNLPSCGSVFKNPSNDYAGRLIESVGLKGTVIGNAQISEKHANFIVNLGGASAMDVALLIAQIRQVVHRETGVVLEPEVRREGVWEDGIWDI